MDYDKTSNQAIYSPRIFEVKNVDEAKSIILTPEKGINTEEVWSSPIPDWLIFPEATKLTFQKVYQNK